MEKEKSVKDGFIIRRSRPLGTKKNPRYVVAEKKTNQIVDDARGFGYKSEENANRGWHYKNRCRTASERRTFSKKNINRFFEEHPGLEEDLEEEIFILFKLDIKPQTVELMNKYPVLKSVDEVQDGFTVVELLNCL